ncbi:MAG: GNAT family N-acetyltransferase [Candidatus Berkiella sp.]|jgi:N-acetylglutamate synthase-like GNAT family acetyltransferase
MDTIEYTIDQNPKPEDDKILREGIVNFNKEVIKEKATHFSIFAKNNSQVVGGALVWEHSDALYIDVLWLHKNYRKKGIGTKIISMIDTVAIDKGISKIFVDTYEFQAQEFYQKHGFNGIGTIPGYLLGCDRVFMRKDIQ